MIPAADGPLRTAFGQIAARDYALQQTPDDAIRAQITEGVLALKAQGLTPEHTLLYVKRVAVDCGVSRHSAQHILKVVIAWTLDAYFTPSAGFAEKRMGTAIEPVVADLYEAFARLRETPGADLDTSLQPAICAVVDALKDRGEGPEIVVKTIKTVAKESGFGGSSHAPDGPPSDVIDSAVSWCIAHYYRNSSK